MPILIVDNISRADGTLCTDVPMVKTIGYCIGRADGTLCTDVPMVKTIGYCIGRADGTVTCCA